MADYELEVINGNKAQKAYNDFIGPFIENKRKEFYETFMSVGIEPEPLMELKRMLTALESLDVEIRSIINTGLMASNILNEGDKK